MQPKRLVAPGRIRRSLLLPALAALVLLVSFTTSCPGPGTNNNNGGVITQSSPATTVSPSPTQGLNPPPPPPPLGTDDRPIIISGGSLDLDFNPLYYQGSSGGGTFRSTNNRITTMRVYDDDATDAAVGLCTVTFAGASDITIAYSIAGGGGSGNVRAVSTAGSAGNSVELTFNVAQLPRRNPNSNKHYNKKASIDSITYTGGSPATCDLGGKKKVTIELEGIPVACAATTTPTPTPTNTP